MLGLRHRFCTVDFILSIPYSSPIVHYTYLLTAYTSLEPSMREHHKGFHRPTFILFLTRAAYFTDIRPSMRH